MASTKLEYAASSALTITLASLASSSTWTSGRQATAVDNTTNKYLDYLLAGLVTVGTSPTSGTEIRVYVVALRDDSTWPDAVGATDAAWSSSSEGTRDGYVKLAAALRVDSTTSNRGYSFGPVSVASLFGGSCPKKFTVVVAHNTGVALNATGGNHGIAITPVFATVA